MTLPEKPLLKPFLLLLSLSLLLLLLLPLLTLPFRRPSSSSSSPSAGAATPLLRIRPGYESYDDYIKHQLNKTLNPRLRRVWATRDWDRKVLVFARFFSDLKSQGLLSNASRSLCVGARLGQEVAALRRVGVADAVGMDLVPSPPLVVAGDFHAQPFSNASFDFEFSNVFDHALYPDRFVAEMERTLRPGGVAVLHVALHRRGDKYSANDLFGVDGIVRLFKQSDLVRVSKFDGFGLDTEVVLRTRNPLARLSSLCPKPLQTPPLPLLGFLPFVFFVFVFSSQTLANLPILRFSSSFLRRFLPSPVGPRPPPGVSRPPSAPVPRLPRHLPPASNPASPPQAVPARPRPM